MGETLELLKEGIGKCPVCGDLFRIKHIMGKVTKFCGPICSEAWYRDPRNKTTYSVAKFELVKAKAPNKVESVRWISLPAETEAKADHAEFMRRLAASMGPRR